MAKPAVAQDCLRRDLTWFYSLERLKMGIVQKDAPLFVNGDESFVARRLEASDSDEGWSVTVRPYRPKPSEEMLRDLNTTNCTCFLAGNRVLMADGTTKAIEHVAIGDMVMTMNGPDRVRMLEQPLLGMTRRVIEIHGLGDECLFMTDEHPLWVSRHLDGAAVENWGVYNVNHFQYEQRNGIEPKIEAAPFALNFDLPEQVAHASGWLHVRPIYHHMAPETKLFNVVTQNACSMLVEGFVVHSHGMGAQSPAPGWRGLAADPLAESFVRRVSLESA